MTKSGQRTTEARRKDGASAPPQIMNEFLGALAPEVTGFQGLKASQNLPRCGGAGAPPFLRASAVQSSAPAGADALDIANH
jgi:hypothetical protein